MLSVLIFRVLCADLEIFQPVKTRKTISVLEFLPELAMNMVLTLDGNSEHDAQA